MKASERVVASRGGTLPPSIVRRSEPVDVGQAWRRARHYALVMERSRR
ncbi:hypothetical protein C7S13_5303 [Burkholderia cepacia]|nr:hypothetical protein [Burkholderia cepacia]